MKKLTLLILIVGFFASSGIAHAADYFYYDGFHSGTAMTVFNGSLLSGNNFVVTSSGEGGKITNISGTNITASEFNSGFLAGTYDLSSYFTSKGDGDYVVIYNAGDYCFFTVSGGIASSCYGITNPTDQTSHVISITQPTIYATTSSPVAITFNYILDGHDPITGYSVTATKQLTFETKTEYHNLSNTATGSPIQATSSITLTHDGTWTLSIDLNDYSSLAPGALIHSVNRPATTVFGLNTQDNVTTINFGSATQTQFASTSCQISFAGSFNLSDCFGYIFIPGSNIFQNYSSLVPQLMGKYPFAYITSIQATWNGLVASSTDNAPTYNYNFHDLGIGSTTSLGNILPNEVVFSASTSKHYFPAGTFELLKGLASIAIILGLFADLFFSTRNLIRT